MLPATKETPVHPSSHHQNDPRHAPQGLELVVGQLPRGSPTSVPDLRDGAKVQPERGNRRRSFGSACWSATQAVKSFRASEEFAGKSAQGMMDKELVSSVFGFLGFGTSIESRLSVADRSTHFVDFLYAVDPGAAFSGGK